ncbi:hypothetical protein [Sphingobacterium sp. 18053]|uniref:hypothetical protein n=1 Tax=Sphingobacterium sp. 18053 TaxID=2681401 RepID=UPI00135C79A5|nr:hypothetical protein [Sphingobacterium sp. 18053]
MLLNSIRLYSFLFTLLLSVPVAAQVPKISDTSKIFSAVDIFLEPRDGMSGFKIRWLNYLKETMNEGKLKKTLYADHVFEVLVVKDGSLVEKEDAARDLVLFDFLRKQQKWKPGIRSGRPIYYLLKLKVPKELFDQVAVEKLVDREDLVKQELLDQ